MVIWIGEHHAQPPNVPESIGLLAVSTSPSGNNWSTTPEPPLVGSFGVSGSRGVNRLVQIGFGGKTNPNRLILTGLVWFGFLNFFDEI